MDKPLNDKPRPQGVGKVSGRQRVTMHDIARAANCSQPTVSYVLNGNNALKISDTTKQRVWEVAEQLGYKAQPRASDKSSRKQATFDDGTIGFLVDTLASSPECVNAFDGIMQAVRTTGNIVLLAETQNDPVQEPKIIQHLLDQNVSAIVYACVFTREVQIPELLKNTDTPVFLLNCYTEDLSFPAVIPGEIAGGHTATNTLINAGHRRIGTITGEVFMHGASGRLAGYRNALASADLPFAEELVVNGNWLPSSGYSCTRQLMALASPPTAIFCQNDRMAVGCYEALKEMGLAIPRDVSVIGYDDDEIARHITPPLTTMNLASRAMGRWVIEQLFHESKTRSKHRLAKLECELIERESVGPPRVR